MLYTLIAQSAEKNLEAIKVINEFATKKMDDVSLSDLVRLNWKSVYAMMVSDNTAVKLNVYDEKQVEMLNDLLEGHMLSVLITPMDSFSNS